MAQRRRKGGMNSKSHELLGIRDIHKDFRGLDVLKGVDLGVTERSRHASVKW